MPDFMREKKNTKEVPMRDQYTGKKKKKKKDEIDWQPWMENEEETRSKSKSGN